MGNNVFPDLKGLKWDQQKTPLFSTRVQKAIGGRESRISYYVYPLYQYDLSYELLRDSNLHNELKTMMGFYLAHIGAWDSFLYIEPSAHEASNQVIGTGDDFHHYFQFQRTYGGNNGNFTEPVFNLMAPGANNAAPLLKVYLDGNLQANNSYSIVLLDDGVIQFNTPPANGVIISADFSYYQRVRFIEYSDDMSLGGGGSAFSQFMKNLWELQEVSFITCR